MRRRWLWWLVLPAALLFLLPMLWPQDLRMPVQGATARDYHPESFWFYPWGRSVTHKGVDVFARQGTPVFSATQGLVLHAGEIRVGGKVVLALGPKWRVHYYAHLDTLNVHSGQWLSRRTQIGTVGDSGNAAGKPPHLHYSIRTLIPYPWRIDDAPQGRRKMWYLNPIDYF